MSKTLPARGIPDGKGPRRRVLLIVTLGVVLILGAGAIIITSLGAEPQSGPPRIDPTPALTTASTTTVSTPTSQSPTPTEVSTTLPPSDSPAPDGRRDDPTPTSTSPTSTPSAPTASPTDAASIIAEIIAQTNIERTAVGLTPLAISVCATEQAEVRVAQLVDEGGFYHLDLGPVLSACSVRSVGENLAVGYASGAAVVDGWMNSPGHKKNLLGNYTHQGISCQKQSGRWLCGAVYVK